MAEECFTINGVILSKAENKFYIAHITTGKEEITEELYNIFKEEYDNAKKNKC